MDFFKTFRIVKGYIHKAEKCSSKKCFINKTCISIYCSMLRFNSLIATNTTLTEARPGTYWCVDVFPDCGI